MNKARKLLQPLIDALAKPTKVKLIGRGSHQAGFFDGLNAAQDALSTLSDDITLADVPTLEWADTWGFQYSKYTHGEYVVKETVNDDGPAHVIQLTHKGESLGYWGSAIKAKRYVEIRIHLASYERALLAELAGGE